MFKMLPVQLSLLIKERGMRRNLFSLLRFLCALLLLIALYSVLFHYIMLQEGRDFSAITGLYWTLTVMSTLGFGDITFTSDLGKLFSLVVLLSGIILLLVMLPFMFIQNFYAPWLEMQKKDRARRTLPPDIHGHVILVGSSPLALNLADALKSYGTRAVLLCAEAQTALELADQGYETIVGEHSDTDVYRQLRVASAAMVVTLDTDIRNTGIAFTIREENPQVPIIARAEHRDSIDILYLAGCTNVFQFHKLLGEALARRVLSGAHRVSIISRFGELVLAEAPVMRTYLVGRTLLTCGLRSSVGINVVGVWERGKFRIPRPDTLFTEGMVLVVAGTAMQIQALDTLMCGTEPPGSSAALLLGCGRVGYAAAAYLKRRGQQFCVVDKSGRFPPDAGCTIQGDAADLEVLEQGGIRTASSVLITTHDDDINIYLTIYCRRLRPDIQIIARATLDRNVGILHAAGADMVLSLASMVTNSVVNLLSPGKTFMLNEGLNIFRSQAGVRLAGRSLAGSGIRGETHCNVVGIRRENGELLINPDPDYVFQERDEIYLIGDSKAEHAYYARYGSGQALLAPDPPAPRDEDVS